MDYANHFFQKSRAIYDNYTCASVPYEFRAELARSHGMVCGTDYTVSLTNVITTVTTPIYFHRYKSNFYNNNNDGSNSTQTVHPVICIRKFKYVHDAIKIYDGYVYFETDESKIPLNLSKLNFTAADSISATHSKPNIVAGMTNIKTDIKMDDERSSSKSADKLEKESWLSKAIDAVKFI